MPSQALQAFSSALNEITDLGRASHPLLDPNAPASLKLARAVGRGQIVLLSSHFERYIYALNEELVTFLNKAGVHGDRLPKDIRLQHSMGPIDELAKMAWERRSDKLSSFVAEESWLWSTGTAGTISHERLLIWMRAPKPDKLIRYFKAWGIGDIFTAVTRSGHTRTALWLGVKGFVELRNNIAHGDYNAQATVQDVKGYIRHARTFCSRVDRKVASHIARLFGIQKPW